MRSAPLTQTALSQYSAELSLFLGEAGRVYNMTDPEIQWDLANPGRFYGNGKQNLLLVPKKTKSMVCRSQTGFIKNLKKADFSGIRGQGRAEMAGTQCVKCLQ